MNKNMRKTSYGRRRRWHTIERLESRQMLSGTPELVANVNTHGVGPEFFGEIASTSNQLLFVVETEEHGVELWRSDGSIDGTTLVADVAPGRAGSYPELWTSIGEVLYFTATTLDTGRELWRTDGTREGTRLLHDINPGPDGTQFGEFGSMGGDLFFSAQSGGTLELWKTDGTADGTVKVLGDEATGPHFSARSLVEVNGTLFFAASTPESGWELWRSDGTEAGTRQVVELFSGKFGSAGPQELVALDDRLLFSISDAGRDSKHQLWQSDGTESGTTLLRDFGDLEFGPTELTVAGNTLFFSVGHMDGRVELWRSDGTVGGTVAVKEIEHTNSPIRLTLVAADNRVFFGAPADSSESELWISDGTADGTVLVTSAAHSGLRHISNFVFNAGRLYFRGYTESSRYEVWVSDGTAEGTRIVKELSLVDADPRSLVAFEDGVVFVASGPGGRELYRTDGSDQGTQQVSEVIADDLGSFPNQITVAGEKWFFHATDHIHGRELWVSDGSAAGTIRLTDITAGTQSTNMSWFTALGDTLLFVANDRTTFGQELWRSDGTVAGTTIVKDILPGRESSNPRDLAVLGQRLVFNTNDGVWVTDGTEQGTTQLTNLAAQTGIVVSGGMAFFSASSAGTGNELWKSDGTVGGTGIVKDINAGSRGSNPGWLVDVGGTLFFQAETSQSGSELWKSDGTSDGTVLVKDVNPGPEPSNPESIAPAGEIAFFTANDLDHGRELWRSDGTEAGTVLVRDSVPGPRRGSFSQFTGLGSELFFESAGELWKSDGTPEGTTQLLHVRTDNLTAIHGELFFSVSEVDFGNELWRSDGTREGTRRITDINPGRLDAKPGRPVLAGEAIVFAAEMQSVGRELWRMSLEPDGPGPLPFTRSGPEGGNVLVGKVSGDITADQQAVDYSMDLRGGQFITLVVRSSDSLTPVLSVTDENRQLIATATATSGTAIVTLDPLQVPEDGTYRLRIEGAGSSAGSFTVDAYLNAEVEKEMLGRDSNNDMTSAQSLRASLDVASAISQSAVVGLASDEDYFSFEMRAGQTASIAIGSESEPVELALYDAAGTLLAAGAEAEATVLQEFVAPVDGVYFAWVRGSGAAYTLVVTRGAGVELRRDDSSRTQPLGDSGRILGHTGQPQGLVVPMQPSGIRTFVDSEGWEWPIAHHRFHGNVAFDSLLNNSVIAGAEDSSREGDSGREVVIGPSIRDHVSATRKIYIPPDAAFIRVLDSVTNVGEVPLVTELEINSSLQDQNGLLRIVGESSGNEEADIGDAWMVFDDIDQTGIPPVTFVWNQDDLPGLDEFSWDAGDTRWDGFITGHFSVDLQPGQTKRVMQFVALSRDRASAIAKAQALAKLDSEAAVRGLSDAEKANLVNFHLPYGDLYEFDANDGDQLTLSVTVSTFGETPNQNPLVPAIELIDPSGAVVASSETGNTVLPYVATATGKYLARVYAREGVGYYALEVTGATASTSVPIKHVVPADGSVVATSPSEIIVDFDQTLLLSSIDASDLMVDGVAATDVIARDHDKLAFTIPTLGTGKHEIRIEPNSILDLAGNALPAYVSSFTVDADPPRVITVSPNSDDDVLVGDHSVSITFDRGIQADTLQLHDFVLDGAVTGNVVPAGFGYDRLTQMLTIDYVGLSADVYQLRLDSNTVVSLAGIALDGEFSSALPSGDGDPGGDFILSLTVDAPPSMPQFKSLRLDGTRISRAATERRLLNAPDAVDRLLVDLPPSTWLSVAVQAEFDVRARIVDNANAEVMAESFSLGDRQTVEFLSADALGEYLVEVWSADGTFGFYNISFLSMAAWEQESLGGPTNDSITNAERIDRTRTPLFDVTGAAQAAVWGEASLDDVDVYRYAYRPGVLYSLAATGIERGTVESLRVLNSAGRPIFVSDTAQSSLDHQIDAFLPGPYVADEFYVEVKGSGSYALVVRENHGFDVEINDDVATAQPLNASGRVVGEIATDGVLFIGGLGGLYVMSGVDGESVLLSRLNDETEYISGLSPSDDPAVLFASISDSRSHRFTYLATDGNGTLGDEFGVGLPYLLAFDPVANVLYRVHSDRKLSQIKPTPTGVELVAFRADAPEHVLGLAFGNELLYATSASQLMAYDPNLDAWHMIGTTTDGAEAVIGLRGLAYDPKGNQLFATKYGDSNLYRIDPDTAKVTLVGETGFADGGSLALVPELQDPTGSGLSVRARSDVYRFELPATATPVTVDVVPLASVADGGEGLVPELRLFDVAGSEIDSTMATLPGPLSLEVPPGAAGEYFVQVVGRNTSRGAYLLQLSEPPVAAPLGVASVSPDISQPLGEVPETLTFDFTSSLATGSVEPSDLTINGFPATKVEFIDHDTVRFTLPHFLPGTYDLELAAGSVSGAYQQPFVGWSGTIDVPLEQVGPLGTWAKRAVARGTVTPAAPEHILLRVQTPSSVTLHFEGDDALAARIELIGPQGETVAVQEVPAGQPGQIERLSLAPGIYSMAITSTGQSSGRFVLTAFYNAVAEMEDNDSPASAQSLDGRFLEVSETASQLTIVGVGDGPMDDDLFAFSLDSGHSATIAVAGLESASAEVQLLDEVGRVLQTGVAGQHEYDQAIEFVAPATGIYHARVNAGNEYVLTITRNATLDLERNNSAADVQRLDVNGVALGAISPTGTLFAQPSDGILHVVDPTSGQVFQIEETVPREALGAAPTVIGFRRTYDPMTGRAYRANRDRVVETVPVRPDNVRQLPTSPIWLDGIAAGNGGLYGVGDLGNRTQLVFFDFASQQWSTIGETGSELNAQSLAFDPFNELLYAVASFETALFRMDPATAELSTIGDMGVTGRDLLFVPGLPDPTRNNAGGIDASDRYQLSTQIGDSIVIETSTPAIPDSDLDPFVQLFDASGNLLAADDNSAADGRNSRLEYTVQSSGPLQIVVSGVEKTQGQYALFVSGDLSGTMLTITSSDPVFDATLDPLPSHISVDFSDRLDIASIDAADLRINHVSALDVEVVDGNTLRFTLPPLLAGYHTWTLGDGVMQSAFGQPLQAFGSSFYASPRPLGPRLGQGFALPGNVELNPGATAEFPVPLDDDQTFGAVIRPAPELAVRAELVDRRGNVLASVSGSPGQELLLPAIEIGQTGTHLLRISSLQDTAGGVQVQGLLNATSERESITGEANNSPDSAEHLRTRNLDTATGKLGFLSGTLEEYRVEQRRLGALHGGSPVFLELALEEAPTGFAELMILTSGDMTGEDRFLTVDIEGVPTQRFFAEDGAEEGNLAIVRLEADFLTAVRAGDRTLRVRIEPSLAVGDQARKAVGARIDYPSRHFTATQRLDDVVVGGRETSINISAERDVFRDGILKVTTRGDFNGPDKTLFVRLEGVLETTLFGDDVGQDGIFTASVPLTRSQIIELVGTNRNIGMAVKPSAAVQHVAGNFVEVTVDYDTTAYTHVDSLREGMALNSPARFRLPAPLAATSGGVLTISTGGMFFPKGAFLDLEVEGLLSQAVFGAADRFDVARHNVRVPLDQSTLAQLQQDGQIEVSLALRGPVDLEPERFVEVGLNYAIDEDYFRFDLVPGQSLSVGVDMQRFEDRVELQLLDERGQVVANGQAAQKFESVIEFEASTAGSYYARVVGGGEYNLVAASDVTLEDEALNVQPIPLGVTAAAMSGTGGLLFSPERREDVYVIDSDTGAATLTEYRLDSLPGPVLGPSFEPRDLFAAIDTQQSFLYRLSSWDIQQLDLQTGFHVGFYHDSVPDGVVAIAFGDSKLFAVSETTTLLYAANVETLQWHVVGDTGRTWLDAGLAYDDANQVLYAKAANDQRLFQIDPRNAATRPLGVTGVLEGGDLGYFEDLRSLDADLMQAGDRADSYQVQVAAGDRLTIETSTPGRGPLHPELLDLFLELRNPAGEVVASDDNSGQGNNARLEFLAAEAGTYVIHVTPRGFASGAYQLRVVGPTGSAATPLELLAQGSGVFHTRIDGQATAEDPVERVFGIDAGRMISIFRPATGQSLPAYSLLDPSGEIVASLPSSQDGSQNAVLRQVSTTSGNYSLRAAGEGRVLADVFVGAGMETESVAGSSNNTRAEAESLDDLYVDVGQRASRAGVVGTVEVGNADYFQVSTRAGDILDFALVRLTGDDAFGLSIEDASGQTVAEGQGEVGSFADIVSRFTSPSDGAYAVRVVGDGQYVLVATRNLSLHRGVHDELLGDITEAIGSIQAGGVLFFAAEDSYQGGLWVLDTDTGTPWAAGSTGRFDDIGLAPVGSTEELIGSFQGVLGRYQIDGTRVDLLRGSRDASGLAYDDQTGRLYGVVTNADQFHLYDPVTGDRVEELAEPPRWMSGLAFGRGGVFGIGGEHFSDLYFYNPDVDTWTLVGNTGQRWHDMGLAYNPFLDQLYAKDDFDPLFYQIDPSTAEVTVIGDTGIRNGGGLAFIPQVIDPTGNGATFSSGNRFEFQLAAASHVEFVTATPRGASLPAGLDARLELYDAHGNLLAADEDGAADAVNARLQFEVPETGRYTLRVVGENGTQGDFHLNVSTMPLEPPGPVALLETFELNGGAAFKNRMESLAIRFSEPVEVQSDALLLRNDTTGEEVDLSAVEVAVFETAAQWDLSMVSLEPGSYSATLRADRIKNISEDRLRSEVHISGLWVTRPGDADLDGQVDFGDFLILAANFGTAGRLWWDGDFNDDTRVDFADFLVLSANFGDNAGSQLPKVLPGDVDLSGNVGFADFLILAGNFGEQATFYWQGDLNGNGQVGFDDFLTLAANFGRTLAHGAASAFASPDDWWHN